ncbi:hydroxysqualene dehydroxylase HpnE [Actinopolymorpha singaporensis]|uniref:Squalene-associated FAD-dependent desaturase n=1 Tax=Actinopolymorpha singaporensis TaxID=117157 RepID=A0A1H1PR20_9ACTN|nr:hydroxysqualene dehydroxylase HpnE [Actinopolymorpha singaporensis]SDS13614.1 squalene-associated FAD-dependent desaturase [Actinopolymorpha singaporensis]
MTSVVVVGGGLAGIAAAVRLADRGARVRLLEARAHLGGATYSLDRPAVAGRSGLVADTGQHVFLRCYHAYRALLERLDVAALAPVQEHLAIPVLHPSRHPDRQPDGHPDRPAWIYRSRRGPAPLHLARSLAAYKPLTPLERLRAGRAVFALRRVDPDDPRRDTATFGEWLREHRQSGPAIERLWGLIAVAALNLPPDEASLALAAKVFRTAFLERPEAADLGVPAVSLRQLHAQPAGRLLERLDVEVHTNAKVLAIDPVSDVGTHRFVLRTRTGELTADAVVVAVPHQAAARLVPARAVPDEGRERWARLGSAPIVNVHLRYDRRVTAFPFAAALDSPVQWIFDRTRAAGVDRGQYLVVSVSAAHAEVGMPTEELRRTYANAVDDLLPGARSSRVVESFVTREPHATFRQSPGTAALRPPTHTGLPGLTLAGAWTATGWPDTMEGAVRSGLRAADALSLTRTPTSRPLGEALS